MVSNSSFDINVPVYSDKQIDQLADLVEEKFLKSVEKSKVEIFISGKPLPLTAFLQQLFSRTLTGMLSALKGWDPGATVEIRLSGQSPREKPSAAGPRGA